MLHQSRGNRTLNHRESTVDKLTHLIRTTLQSSLIIKLQTVAKTLQNKENCSFKYDFSKKENFTYPFGREFSISIFLPPS